MTEYGAERLRNVVLLSHSGAGKTSLTEAMLYATGAITRAGTVEEGTTVAELFGRLGVEERFLQYVVPYVDDDPKDLSYVLRDGDELRPYVPVSGG